MLLLQNITYLHPNRDVQFSDLNLTIHKHSKVALIGNNGMGKSTILKLLTGELLTQSGLVKTDTQPYYIPQVISKLKNITVAHVLNIYPKIKALKEVLAGNATIENFDLLNDDWDIEERSKEALADWGLLNIDLSDPVEKFSGGEITKIYLSGISIHQPLVILMDEPSNHLDASGRDQLYSFIERTKSTLVIVSHDKTLLNLMTHTIELNRKGLTHYGGNYDFYIEQKNIQNNALQNDILSKEKSIKQAKETERIAAERKQKMDVKGKKKQEKAGLPKIMLNTLRNNAENSAAQLKSKHQEKIDNLSSELSQLRNSLNEINPMKITFEDHSLHNGKTLFKGKNINLNYERIKLWKRPLSFQILSGERIAIKGANGSGKTSLINVLINKIKPSEGIFESFESNILYFDQNYSLINNQLSVYEQAQKFNSGHLLEHEVKIRLHRFLFTKNDWDKTCGVLSGGEKMRLMLCSLIITQNQPSVIILDEPTNNLDIQNLEILANAIRDFNGTLIVISHDTYFLSELNISREIWL